MKRKPVKSSNIKSVGYESRVMEIEFHKGDVYNFFDVPEEIYNEMIIDKSVGRYFYRYVKGKYDFELKPRSSCCNADTMINGDVTRYYTCAKCGKPCDPK